MPQTLPDFPAGSMKHLQTPEALQVRSYALRRASAEDLPFLQHLYAETRAAELRATGWPQALCERFVADQFVLQHTHYVRRYADADFLVLQLEARAIGRLYLQREASDDLIIDIALLAEVRGRGVGSALIIHIQQNAARTDRGVRLHVDLRNEAAYRLYLRLGFRDTGVEGAYRGMRWDANVS
ncbi:GNAT family N-acetyltransferase [Oleiagrimonas soli]|uniref:Ribosomal protein S18 acetylase RimI-like enzyme n=1 Tax=Oleiagrimonas soli TaxID=1543381 RepID=A0A841KIF4_9GAMM|nr:GNAT family N-acetyltransferase [Oleiagrimonas soli]MBB6184835.1 ribosomal protein S18 acetylase RimI-like enzyme [Oleiagrimonas soli]